MTADLGVRVSSNSLHVDVALELLESLYERSEDMCCKLLIVQRPTVPSVGAMTCTLPPDHEGPHSASGFASWVSL